MLDWEKSHLKRHHGVKLYEYKTHIFSENMTICSIENICSVKFHRLGNQQTTFCILFWLMQKTYFCSLYYLMFLSTTVTSLSILVSSTNSKKGNAPFLSFPPVMHHKNCLGGSDHLVQPFICHSSLPGTSGKSINKATFLPCFLFLPSGTGWYIASECEQGS